MARQIIQTIITAQQGQPHQFKGDILMLGLYNDTKQVPGEYVLVDKAADGAIGHLLEIGDFAGKSCENAILYTPGNFGCRRIMVVGLGEKEKFEPEILRQTIGTAVRAADKLAAGKIGLALPAEMLDGKFKTERIAQAVSEGAIAGRYEFEDYLPEKKENGKSSPKTQITLLAVNASQAKIFDQGCKIGSVLAQGQNVARMIANKPANEINPPTLAREAQRLAKQFGLHCKIYDDRELLRMKMNAILAVGNSSASKPRLILLEYNGRRGGAKTKGPDVIVVGKAVTFDSGGIDLKPSPKMELMKFDKCGGCDVLGIMTAAARLKLPLRVVGLIPSAENLISDTCYRPGDIVRTCSGKTVEILSTDAEGRMLLCDALTLAVKMKPDAIVDLATLTGACAVALGEHYAGLFGNDDSLLNKFKAAAELSGERVWHLPSGPEYLEQMKSKIADLKNVGVREGGASMAAAFLGEFVDGIPWVHLDIACVAKPDTDKPWRDSGATGFGVRLVLEYLRSLVS